MTDLTTNYLGLTLKNPVIAGASGLTGDLGMIKKLEDAGAGAVVCKSLFEEEIQLKSLRFQREIHQYDDIHPEMLTVFPQLEYSGPEEHLFWLSKAAETVDIPVIASLNAVSPEVWLEYAEKIEQTGVDALELNLYEAPADSQSSTEQEENQLALVREIRKKVSLPIAVKIGPHYTDIMGFVEELDKSGIDGVVLFNRFFAPNIDIHRETLTYPMSFSRKEDNRLPLRYTGLLHGKIQGSLCSSGGIMDGSDALRMLLAGADTIQVVSTLYRNTHLQLDEIVTDIINWMSEKGYSEIGDFRGKLSSGHRQNLWAYKRTQYVKMLMQSSSALAEQILL